MKNPFLKNSAAVKWEHRFERLQPPNSELHFWRCDCGPCNIIKNFCHSEYKIIIVDEASDPLSRSHKKIMIALED